MKELGFLRIRDKAPLITVIMPVYNSQNFISDAIESVLCQTYPNFELLLIDDGSTDDSKKICDEYAKKDMRVKSIHKKNGGVCSSRNFGIDMAKGEYLAFIDNDDIYNEDYLEVLLSNIDARYDVIKCGRKNVRVTANGRESKQTVMTVEENKFLDFDAYVKNYYYYKRSEIWGSVWNGLYKVDFLKQNKLRFDENLKHGNEDLIFNYQVLLKKPKIYIYKDVLYTHYYRMQHSTSMKFYEDQISSRIYAIKLEKNIINGRVAKKDRMLIEFEEIRECFRILAQCKNKEVLKESICEIEKELDYSVMNNNALYQKKLDYKQAIDLFLLKKHLYNLYFFYKKIQRLVGL